MPTEHTPEPWRTHRHFDDWHVYARSMHPVAQMEDLSVETKMANAARIIACVNACVGLSNEDLVEMTRRSARFLADLVNAPS